MIIRLEPVNDDNRDAVLALSVREDQPFVATNEVSLRQAAEANKEDPGVARPFAIYADDRLVGFCMFAVNPEDEDEDDRDYLWRFMIDKNEQGKGYGRTGSCCPQSPKMRAACMCTTRQASGIPGASTAMRPFRDCGLRRKAKKNRTDLSGTAST